MASPEALEEAADSYREAEAALLDRVVSEPSGVTLSTSSAAELKAELAAGMLEPVAVTTLEDADLRIKVW